MHFWEDSGSNLILASFSRLQCRYHTSQRSSKRPSAAVKAAGWEKRKRRQPENPEKRRKVVCSERSP